MGATNAPAAVRAAAATNSLDRDSNDTMKRNRSNSEPAASKAMPSTIGFRLDEESRRRLAELAQAKNVSMHQYAHYLVIDSLYSREKAARDMDEFHEHLRRLRRELASTASALLIRLGKVSPSEAQEWVRDTFK